jgi:hypothetical protein
VRSPFELLAIRFDDVADETVHRLVAKTRAAGHVRIISAIRIRHEPDGSVSIDESTEAADVLDMAVDVAAHRRWFQGRRLVSDMVRRLPVGAAVLVLLVEHRWALQMRADVGSLGGVMIDAASLPEESVRQAQQDLN